METQMEFGQHQVQQAFGMDSRDFAAERYQYRAADEAMKQEQRGLVLKHFLSEHEPNETVRLLSLPDEFWTFERLLDSRRGPRCVYTGIQWSWMHLERGVKWMPGEEKASEYTERIQIGEIKGYRRNRSRVVYAHAGHFLQIRQEEVMKGLGAQTKHKHRDWNVKYRHNTAIWLDLQCQISSEFFRAAQGIGKFCSPAKERVPAVVSFLAARDGFASDDERMGAAIESLEGPHKYRRFVLTDIWRHQTASSPYISIAGVFIRTRPLWRNQFCQSNGEAVA